MPYFEQRGNGVVHGLLGRVHAAVAQLPVPAVDPAKQIGDRGRNLVPLWRQMVTCLPLCVAQLALQRPRPHQPHAPRLGADLVRRGGASPGWHHHNRILL